LTICLVFGYYTVNVYKNFGVSRENLNNDFYLSNVGSAAALFNSLRFVWSGALDKFSFKYVYGTYLLMQIFFSITMKFAAESKNTYAIWVCMALFTEGAGFALVPNIYKKIYGDQATSLYGVAFTYPGIASLILLPILASKFGETYILFWAFTCVLNVIALLILIFMFNEDKY
jgi:hypothetical protein